MATKDTRYFALRENGRETALFSGKAPRQAALKAANRGYTDIRLRERGTKKVHIFRGGKEVVDAPANRPAWLPARINKPWVKKVGVEKLAKF